MKKILCIILSLTAICNTLVFANEANAKSIALDLASPSAILLDVHGNVIYEKNADEVKAPASVTKIMTMLLAFESIEQGKIKKEDMVTVSELAARQGGTQVFLETGEQISVDELLKSIAVSSANDASVALGEFIAGTNEGFVQMMNEKAQLLSMDNTVFKNANGLPEEGHVTSSRDIAKMSVEILKYPDVYNYATIWMDSIRNGAFELANTNKLLKSYQGLVGLKTGFTEAAMYCISATAKRDGEQFIAVVMGSPSSKERNTDIAKMLDFAFANYKTITPEITEELQPVAVKDGQQELVKVELMNNNQKFLVKKSDTVEYTIDISNELLAPIKIGDKVGNILFNIGENSYTCDIVASENVDKIDFTYILKSFMKAFFMKI